MRNVCELFSSFPYLMKEAEFGEREGCSSELLSSEVGVFVERFFFLF